MATIDIAYIDKDHDGDAEVLRSIQSPRIRNAPDGTSERKASTGRDWVIGLTPVTSTDPPSSAATTVELRAERCAQIGSRNYTISVTCTDGALEEIRRFGERIVARV